MLTVESAVEHLKEAQAELDRLDKDRDTLVEMVRVYEKFIALRGGSVGKTNGVSVQVIGNDPFAGVPTALPAKGKSEAVKAIIKAAQGAPLHPKEIVSRLHAQGVKHEVDSKKPWRHGLDFILLPASQRGRHRKGPRAPRLLALES